MNLIKPSYEILTEINGDRILKNIEKAGRTCYKSEDKITKDSAIKFVNMVTKRGHHSVIEHESISINFICDRGVTHEMVRHRLCAYSQESTRYCNYKGGVAFIIPPWVNIEPGEYNYESIFDTLSFSQQLWLKSMLDSESSYKNLLLEGWSPQQARSVLPNSLKTEIVWTANIREWRHIFNLRCSKAAHPQIKEVMFPALKDLNEQIPVLFEDIYEEYK